MITNMYSIVKYVGDGANNSFSIPFPYIAQNDLKVYIDGVLTTSYTITGTNTLVTNQPIQRGSILTIKRETIRDRLVDFQDGSTIHGDSLNLDSIQMLYLVQEMIDLVESTPRLGEDDKFDMRGKVLKALGTPIDDFDAATKEYVDRLKQLVAALEAQAASSAENALSNAKAAETYAFAISDVLETTRGLKNQADVSAANAKLSETNAGVSAGDAQASANLASNKALLASDKALEASNSAAAASTSASNANTSSTSAASSAAQAQASHDAAVVEADRAAAKALEAGTSASSASVSASQAQANYEASLIARNDAQAAASTATSKAAEAEQQATLAKEYAEMAQGVVDEYANNGVINGGVFK